MPINSSRGRFPALLLIRNGRMLKSPFASFRGAAAVMASDLAHTPITGLRFQARGDSDIMNIGSIYLTQFERDPPEPSEIERDGGPERTTPDEGGLTAHLSQMKLVRLKVHRLVYTPVASRSRVSNSAGPF